MGNGREIRCWNCPLPRSDESWLCEWFLMTPEPYLMNKNFICNKLKFFEVVGHMCARCQLEIKNLVINCKYHRGGRWDTICQKHPLTIRYWLPNLIYIPNNCHSNFIRQKLYHTLFNAIIINDLHNCHIISLIIHLKGIITPVRLNSKSSSVDSINR